ncbi:MAG TPA: XdhC/CoxI family protein [Thermoplasmata archaeon]|nr:XdhC/CoxI family protein [Thermoplasmata archaeon]
MDRRLTREALRLMELHQPFVRATVVRATGSVPGKVGATMIVRADGTTVGTVGGAALEERVKTLAARALEDRAGDLHHFDLQAWTPGGLPSLCGGSVDIAVEYVGARPNLLLWGGGHVAHALATILPTLEYDYSVADDRPEWIGPDRFPSAERREVVAPGELWTRWDPASFTHLYVLGYDAGKDLEVLHSALTVFPNQIGLIASAAKRAHMYATLREQGVGRDALARIRSPVGLEIGAQTPAEIAVSIVAELVRGMHPTDRRSPSPADRAPAPEDDVVSRTP